LKLNPGFVSIPDIIRFNQAFFDSSFLTLESLAAWRETSFVLRIYLPNRGKGAKEEAKKSFFVT
jgi:hypothetical protein